MFSRFRGEVVNRPVKTTHRSWLQLSFKRLTATPVVAIALKGQMACVFRAAHLPKKRCAVTTPVEDVNRALCKLPSTPPVPTMKLRSRAVARSSGGGGPWHLFRGASSAPRPFFAGL